jgi:PAS domain S-box-containing protein
MATDVCWETDATLRITTLAWRNRHGRLMPMTDEYLGQRPWEMPVLSIDDEVLDLLRVNVDGRDRVEDLAMAWRCPDGRRRHYLVSGEPAFDAAGRFCGYWGVARDVSAERTARLAMQAASRRYLRLFWHMPVPMLVHRDGRMLEANAAAAALLGYAHPEAMVGHDLLEEHMDHEQREMALERLDDLDADPALEVLPAVPRRLLRCDGEPVFTLATGMRTEHGGHPAMLAIYLDESARHGALQAQQRSEALLTRVLSLTPDLVALCTLDDGRCVLVNDGLGRLLGLPRNRWMGPGAQGPWTGRAVFDQLVASAQAQGGVRDQPVVFGAADGSTRELLVHATLLTLDDGRYLLMHARLPAAGSAPPWMRTPDNALA